MYSDRCSVCINLAPAASVDPALDGSDAKTLGGKIRERRKRDGSGRGSRRLVGRGRKAAERSPFRCLSLLYYGTHEIWSRLRTRTSARITRGPSARLLYCSVGRSAAARKVPNGEVALLKKDQARDGRCTTSRHDEGIIFYDCTGV